MAEHYPRNTVSVSAWCSKCCRATPHKVSFGRKAHCLRCTEKQEATIAARKAEDAKKPVQRQIDWLPPAA